MANANKNKGKSYEREVCKKLSTIFGLNFERVPASGAFTGGANYWRLNKLTQEQQLVSEGDIIVPNELAHIKLECKFYKDFSFVSLFENNEILNKWIEQAKSGNQKRHWFLLFKINRQGDFIVFDRNTLKLTEENVMLYKKQYYIIKCDGFFEKYKEFILNLGYAEEIR